MTIGEGPHKDEKLIGYTGASFAEENESRRFTTGYAWLLYGSPRYIFSKQKCCALSSAESELVAAVEAAKTCIYLRRLPAEFGESIEEHVTLYGDNKATITL